jgi:hypothetical protein
MKTLHSKLETEESVESLERGLSHFSTAIRASCLEKLRAKTVGGGVVLPKQGSQINMHAHTFYSYNAYGYSPTEFAWRARKEGLAVAGIVDFDGLDGLPEFFGAGKTLGLRTCGSIESRVFLPEYTDTVFNSPGEPGVLYHMGVGFPRKVDHSFLEHARGTTVKRIADMVARINAYLGSSVSLDYTADVLSRTPKGYATERHVCEAYVRKAKTAIADKDRRTEFWKQKLGSCPASDTELQTLIRTKTMKKGGVGYITPDSTSFLPIEEMNRFILESGAIPTLAWLDGTNEGEKDVERLFALAKSYGMAAVNIIPDRNYTPGDPDGEKYQKLLEAVRAAEAHGFPIIAGTEMNAPGNKFVDSFETAELAPLASIFLRGAHIVYGHTVLQRHCGLGYLSSWAKHSFENVHEKNEFFDKVGSRLRPDKEECLEGLTATDTPSEILKKISGAY